MAREPEDLRTLEEIEVREETGLYQNSVVVAVAFSSTFTAVTTFFTSILISRYNSFDPTINIPTLFLIISTFGFLYSTLIYANIVGLVARGHIKKAGRSGFLGNILSEYMGLYFLILAVPLIINVISQDPFLRIGTALVDMGGLGVYHISGFSIMERHYGKFHYLFLSILLILEFMLVIFQFVNVKIFEALTGLMICFIFGLAGFARKEQVQDAKDN